MIDSLIEIPPNVQNRKHFFIPFLFFLFGRNKSNFVLAKAPGGRLFVACERSDSSRRLRNVNRLPT